MTDAHTHIDRGDTRSLVCEPTEGSALFVGLHPWEFLEDLNHEPHEPHKRGDCSCGSWLDNIEALRARIESDPSLGVGEIGLDRLKTREIPHQMREAFAAQLEIAAEFGRPVVLHGAKCWGQVVEACRPYAGKIPAFLFHGFSRSGGLVPEIVKMNGFISVGPAVLNDHAVNYRELVKAIPQDRILFESDATAESAAETPRVAAVAAKAAEIRGVGAAELAEKADENAENFL